MSGSGWWGTPRVPPLPSSLRLVVAQLPCDGGHEPLPTARAEGPAECGASSGCTSRPPGAARQSLRVRASHGARGRGTAPPPGGREAEQAGRRGARGFSGPAQDPASESQRFRLLLCAAALPPGPGAHSGLRGGPCVRPGLPPQPRSGMDRVDETRWAARPVNLPLLPRVCGVGCQRPRPPRQEQGPELASRP